MRRAFSTLAAVFAAIGSHNNASINEIRTARYIQGIRTEASTVRGGWCKPAKPKNQRQRRKRERQNPHLRLK